MEAATAETAILRSFPPVMYMPAAEWQKAEWEMSLRTDWQICG